MGKRLIVALALALAVGSTFSAAYAEVQNVKVSGDIIASGVARNHFGLNRATAGDNSALKESFLMSQIRVRIDADLTDNVMTTVRLINERIWNGQNDTNSTNASNSTNIDLDLAYVTLKEFLYSPLTLTVGRQEIKFGNGLIIGKSGAAAGTTNIPTDLSERSAFDAIRATLNYDPLVVDLIYAKVRQTATDDRDSIGLAGINATYALNKKTNVSGYYFIKKDAYKIINTTATTANTPRDGTDKVNVVGGLISSTPIDNLTTSLEAAYQFGRAAINNTIQKNHDAYSLQAMADYTFAKVKTTPKIGASYTYLSGYSSGDTRDGGWDAMFYDQKLNNITYAILPMTNMSVLNLKASCKPVEDVTVAAVYGYYDVAQKGSGTLTSPGSRNGLKPYLDGVDYTGKTHLGDAIDATITYDYTEDVQFGLTGGMFKAGNALNILGNKQTATQLIGSMKVTF